MLRLLYQDIIVHISSFLSDNEKLKFTSTNKYMNCYKFIIKYDQKHDYEKIKSLSFYKNFNKVKYIARDNKIPSSVTHLTFRDCFNQEIKDCIPTSVINLTFGFHFNQNIKNCIPPSVTYLTFGYWFNQDIRDCIPASVSHLTFGFHFNQDIKDCISSR